MYKLVILIEALDDWSAFEAGWPDFLHHAERMPGLRREATSRVDGMLYGQPQYTLMHELFFDSPEAARQAMSSPQGRLAGKTLQEITQGKMALFFADHKEDALENIRKYQQSTEEEKPPGDRE